MGKIEGHIERRPLSEAEGNITGWIRGSDTFNRGDLQYVTYYQTNVAVSDSKILGHGMTVIHESGSSTDRTQNGQYHITVQSGATVESRGGDPNAGMHNLHGKVTGNSGSTWNSGCRVAPFWSDIQISGTDVSGEEVYHFFASAGGSRARALLRMEDQIADRFLESDGSLGEGFYADSGYNEPNGSTAEGWLVVNVGGTDYGVPLMAAT